MRSGMKTGRIIPGGRPANNCLGKHNNDNTNNKNQAKKLLLEAFLTPLFYAHGSDNDSSATGFLGRSVQLVVG